MIHIKIPQPWEVPDHAVTGEHEYWSRRRFLQSMGIGAVSGALAGGGLFSTKSLAAPYEPGIRAAEPLPSGPALKRYNNYAEFSHWSAEVPRLAQSLDTRAWRISISGLVDRPLNLSADDLIRKMPLEERVYRFRCVEGWAMRVPWWGFPLHRLLALVQPQAAARYVRFTSFFRPEVAPGQRVDDWHVWPYAEALSMEESASPLTFMASGVYGRDLPKEQGAPLRLVVPWKYAVKSIKSVTRIELVNIRPDTFWTAARPGVCDFSCNVHPDYVSSIGPQREEIVIGSGERRPTLPYNGYSEVVAAIYR
jgi:sulfoxide reductase catalytic subunit YedY